MNKASVLKVLALTATCFGIGKIRPAPGTWGTLVAVPFAFFLAKLSPLTVMVVTFALVVFALFCCEAHERFFGAHDSQDVVIDEFVGYLIAVIWLPLTWQSFVFAFILFRFLDITKPLLIGRLDRELKGGVGTLADDVAAGIVANAILQVVFHQTNWLGHQLITLL